MSAALKSCPVKVILFICLSLYLRKKSFHFQIKFSTNENIVLPELLGRKAMVVSPRPWRPSESFPFRSFLISYRLLLRLSCYIYPGPGRRAGSQKWLPWSCSYILVFSIHFLVLLSGVSAFSHLPFFSPGFAIWNGMQSR